MIIVLSSTLVCAEQQKLVIALVDHEIFPFIMGDGEKVKPAHPGITIETFQLLGKRLKLPVTFVRVPWKRALLMLQRGEVDGVVASFKPERKKYGMFPMKNNAIDPSRRISAHHYVLYTLSETKLEWDKDQRKFINLKGAIGAPLGYSVVDELKKCGAQVECSRNTLSNLEKLLLGRIVALADLDTTIDPLLKKQPEKYKNIKKFNSIFQTKPYYLVLSHQFLRRSPALAKRIWDTLVDLRIKETDRLYEKYLCSALSYDSQTIR